MGRSGALCYRYPMNTVHQPRGLTSRATLLRGALVVLALLVGACSTTPQQPAAPTLGEMLATANVERIDGGVSFVNVGWSPLRPAPCSLAYGGYSSWSCWRLGYRYPYFGLYYPYYGHSPYYAWGPYFGRGYHYAGWGHRYYPWWGYGHRPHDRGHYPSPPPASDDPDLLVVGIPAIGTEPVGARDDFQVKPGSRTVPGAPVRTISPVRGVWAPGSSLTVSPTSPVTSSSGGMTVRSRGDQKTGPSRAQLPVQRGTPGFSRPTSRPVQRSSAPRSKPASRPAPRARISRPSSRPSSSARISSKPES